MILSKRLSNILIGSAVLALTAGGVGHAAEKDIAETPLGLEFKRGNDAADECGGMKMLKATPTSYETCLDALHDKLHKQGGNLAAFDAGFWIAAWFQVDPKVRPDRKFTGMAEPKPEWKPLDVKVTKAYVEARTKAGLTDDQSLHLALLDHELFKPRLESGEKGL
jgi:hypothetical protein